jgi:hypothetical protein
MRRSRRLLPSRRRPRPARRGKAVLGQARAALRAAKRWRRGARGHFDDDELATRIWKWRLRSRIQRKLFPKRAVTQADFDLFVAIIAKGQGQVRRFSQGSDLHVLIWPNVWFEQMEERFDALGISHYRIVDGLPGYTEDKSQYRIHEKDSHPNRLANRLLARYIVRDILGLPLDDAKADSEIVRTPRH